MTLRQLALFVTGLFAPCAWADQAYEFNDKANGDYSYDTGVGSGASKKKASGAAKHAEKEASEAPPASSGESGTTTAASSSPGVFEYDVSSTPARKPASSASASPGPTDASFTNHRAPKRDQLFVYQGDYRKLGKTVADVAKALKPYDVILLSHAFSVIHHADPLLSQPAGKAIFADALKSQNGTCSDARYADDNGDGVPELMKLLRAQNPDVRIYGYIPATSDLFVRHNQLNAKGEVEVYATCWSSKPEHLSYSCPNGMCLDFVRWVGKWRALENNAEGIWLDGFYIDMVNAVHVSPATWTNLTSYLASLRNGFESRYLVMANTLETAPSAHHADPIGFAATGLQAGDSVLVEGFYLKAGTINAEFAALKERLARLHREKGIEWSAIANEKGYRCDEGDVGYEGGGGVAAQEAGSACQPWLISQAICGMDNFRSSYGAFKEMHGQGARAFLYSESNLGLYSGVATFCPHR